VCGNSTTDPDGPVFVYDKGVVQLLNVSMNLFNVNVSFFNDKKNLRVCPNSTAGPMLVYDKYVFQLRNVNMNFV